MHFNTINYTLPVFQDSKRSNSTTNTFKGRTECLIISDLYNIPNRVFNGERVQVGSRMCKIWHNSRVKEIMQDKKDTDRFIISGNCPNLERITVENAKIINAKLPNLSEIYCSGGFYGYDDISGELDIINSQIGSLKKNLIINNSTDQKNMTPDRYINIHTHNSFLYSRKFDLKEQRNATIIPDFHIDKEISCFDHPIITLAEQFSKNDTRPLETSQNLDMDNDF